MCLACAQLAGRRCSRTSCGLEHAEIGEVYPITGERAVYTQSRDMTCLLSWYGDVLQVLTSFNTPNPLLCGGSPYVRPAGALPSVRGVQLSWVRHGHGRRRM
jgi:hypothetical protein